MEKRYFSISKITEDKKNKLVNLYDSSIRTWKKFLEILKQKISLENYYFLVYDKKLEAVVEGIDSSYVSFTIGKGKIIKAKYQSIHGDIFITDFTLNNVDYKVFSYLELSGLRRKS